MTKALPAAGGSSMRLRRVGMRLFQVKTTITQFTDGSHPFKAF
ncbi:hypothetical protein PGR6_07160 [Pseudomonas sp. GR 6-02]|nr:hypothetical protein PGR6_07160 [Pseudomonas sp. GR 6-02]